MNGGKDSGDGPSEKQNLALCSKIFKDKHSLGPSHSRAGFYSEQNKVDHHISVQ